MVFKSSMSSGSGLEPMDFVSWNYLFSYFVGLLEKDNQNL
jgi:hypothetical protein